MIFDVNLKGAWLTTKSVATYALAPRGQDHLHGLAQRAHSGPNYAHYVAAKHGLLGYMKALAIELGPFEINVNAVCPTQMVDKSRPPRSTSRPYWERVVGHPAATSTRSLISNPVKRTCSTGAASSISPTWLRRCSGWHPIPRAP